MSATLASMDLTSSQGHILAFIAHQPDPPCSRQIEEAFQLSHPTVSGILSRLEKKGFIEFHPDPADRRCKRIHLGEKGRECHSRMDQTIIDNEHRMVQDFTPEERQQFADFLQRAILNMGGSPCKPFPKEEND
ncbi:MAG: MarR family transcriptional regulator [Oscillospiraceae bacterium]|nr:MarR family transcriptional regulator [Oscillospiraceae bacterium]